MSLLATTSARLHANSIPARVIAVTAAAALTSSVAIGQTFTNLGVLDANHQRSQAVAISGNGQRATGRLLRESPAPNASDCCMNRRRSAGETGL
jgi:hypothetical protein